MVYRERTSDGITRLTGSLGGGGGAGLPGQDGQDGVDGKTPDLRAVSTTSVTIGTGNKTFALSPAMNVSFPLGAVVRAYGAVNTDYMTGTVVTSSTTSVTINVTETSGVGTFASWTVVVSGFRGASGLTGTRWGSTGIWITSATANCLVSFTDGLPPRIGDLVVTNNGFEPGAVYKVTGVVDSTHANLDVTGINLRGPQGPPGDNALVGWPVGSIFIGYGPVSPATLLGGGTWVIFGSGQVLVGFNSADVDFDADGKNGGAKKVTLTTAEMPSHDHGSGSYEVVRKTGVGTSTGVAQGNTTAAASNAGVASTSGLRGGGGAHENMPPYIVVHFWRRTA